MTESLIARAQAALVGSRNYGDGRPSRAITQELLTQALANKTHIEALEIALAGVEAALKNAIDVSVLVSQWGNGLRHNAKHEALMVKTARAALKGSTP